MTSEREGGRFSAVRLACTAFQAEKGAQISTEVRRRRGLVIFRPTAVVATANAYAGRADVVSGDLLNSGDIAGLGGGRDEGRFRWTGVVSDDCDIRDAGPRSANLIHADAGDRVGRGAVAKRKRASATACMIRNTFGCRLDGGEMVEHSSQRGLSSSWRLCKRMKTRTQAS